MKIHIAYNGVLIKYSRYISCCVLWYYSKSKYITCDTEIASYKNNLETCYVFKSFKLNSNVRCIFLCLFNPLKPSCNTYVAAALAISNAFI
jgi:hypothetical protein